MNDIPIEDKNKIKIKWSTIFNIITIGFSIVTILSMLYVAKGCSAITAECKSCLEEKARADAFARDMNIDFFNNTTNLSQLNYQHTLYENVAGIPIK